MGLITLIVAGVYASHLTTRLEHAISPPRSRVVDQVNMQLVYSDTQLSSRGEDVVIAVHIAVVIGVFALVSLPFILLGVASAGIAIPLIIAGLFVVAIVANSVAMRAVWHILESEER